MDLGRTLRRARGLAWELSGVNAWARARLDGSRGFILNYHRVVPTDVALHDAVEEAMYVTPEAFRMQLELLAERFHPMPLGELAARVRDGRALPRGACAICFDDGWRDNVVHALPELERTGMPATIFVVTERMGTQGAFWPDDVCRRLAPLAADRVAEIASGIGSPPGTRSVDGVLEHLKALSEAERIRPLEALREAAPQAEGPARELLDWDELERLRDAGIAIESHGATHAILTGLNPAEAERELRTSLHTLRERGFAADKLFAYPSGRHAPWLHELVAEVGYRAAFILDERMVEVGAPPMALSRMGMHQGIGGTRFEFLCKVPGWA